MKLKEFMQNAGWKKWDKSQWTIVILAGVLLMVLAIPTEGRNQKKESAEQKTESGATGGNAESSDSYARRLEASLKKALSKIDGAGRVHVMITFEDSGESVVEKDVERETSDKQETGGGGENRAEKSARASQTTVYYEESSDKLPFVEKEVMPKIAGVLVIAQGGGNTEVKRNISEAVMALFQIDVNRIKVVKMNIQEEG